MRQSFPLLGATIAGFAMMSLVNFGSAQSNQDTDTETAISMEYAEIFLGPPGAPVHAGYLVLRNENSEAVYLNEVASSAFGSVQLHRTEIIEDVARMRPISAPLVIPGNSELVMTKGGIHLMLSEAIRPPIAGQSVTLNVTLTDGRTVPVEAKLNPFGSPLIDHHHE